MEREREGERRERERRREIYREGEKESERERNRKTKGGEEFPTGWPGLATIQAGSAGNDHHHHKWSEGGGGEGKRSVGMGRGRSRPAVRHQPIKGKLLVRFFRSRLALCRETSKCLDDCLHSWEDLPG